MKLILHHLAKDIRAQCWLLVLSFLVIALQIAADLLEAQADYHLADMAEFIRSTEALPLTGSILWFLLIARLIQSEPVTGAASFWLTRPIPRSIYISSKLLFILLFLVVPYLIPTSLDMLHFGVDPSHIWVKVRNSLLSDLYFILIALWLATYTRTMMEFWLVLIATGLAAIVIGAMVVSARFYFGNYSEHIGEVMFTRWAMFVLIFFSGLFISLLIQHTRRKASAGFGVGVSCIVIAVLMGFFCPFALPFFFTRAFSLSSSTLPDRSDFIKYSDDWRQRISWMRNPNTQKWVALSTFSPVITNAPQIPIIQNITATFKPDGGQMKTLSSDANLTNDIDVIVISKPDSRQPEKLSKDFTGSFPAEIQFDVEKAIAADLPGIQLTNMPTELRPGPLSLFVLNSSDEHLIGKTGVLSLSFFGYMQSLVCEAVIPLGGQLIARQPGEIIHVARLPRVPQTFIPVETGDKPVLAVWNLAYGKQKQFPPSTRYYLLVDPQRKTGTFLHSSQAIALNDGFSVFSSKKSGHVYLPLAGDEPLDRMVLYIYEFKEYDFFDATLAAPNFSMSPKQ